MLLEDSQNASAAQALLASASPAAISSWHAVSAAQYEINATGNGSFLLVFAESYHPQWGVYVLRGNQTFDWLDTIAHPSVAPHFKVNGWSQAFWVDSCEGTCHVVAYYRPQAYLQLGAILSLAVLALVLLATAMAWKKDWTFPDDGKKKEKKR